MRRQPRVFLGVLDIGGYYGALTHGLRELGVEAHAIDLGQNVFQYAKTAGSHPILSLYKWSYAHFHKTRTLSRINPLRYLWTATNLIALGVLLTWICVHFDIVVLKSGIGLTGNLFDLRLFKWSRKAIVFIYHGSDSRPPYLNAYWDEHMSGPRLVEWTRQIKSHVDRVSPFADYILDNPLSAHFQTRSACTVQCLGNFVDPGKIQLAVGMVDDYPQKPKGKALRILHAPSLRGIKGSDQIRETIGRLQDEGNGIDYIEISNQPNAVVIREILQSDLVVDELYSDTHGAMFALEAAALGKPSIVCGYGRDELKRFVPPEATVPTHYCLPEEFENALRRMLNDEEYRMACGQRAREFSKGWASPKAAASRLLMIAQGNAPRSWFFDPKEIRYIYGFGGKPEKIVRVIRKLLDHGGKKALLLEDKPAVRDRIVDFSKSNLSNGS
jgi:glycosyltransferase involved in cell wall biosynthesis